MGKWEKRLEKIRRNPKNVRFDEIELVLLSLGFIKRQDGTSHAVFVLKGVARLTIPKPHGSSCVKERYIKDELLPVLEKLGLFEEE